MVFPSRFKKKSYLWFSNQTQRLNWKENVSNEKIRGSKKIKRFEWMKKVYEKSKIKYQQNILNLIFLVYIDLFSQKEWKEKIRMP